MLFSNARVAFFSWASASASSAGRSISYLHSALASAEVTVGMLLRQYAIISKHFREASSLSRSSTKSDRNAFLDNAASEAGIAADRGDSKPIFDLTKNW